MYEPIQFGDLSLRGDRPFLILEAGVNYENSFDTALRMVEEAAAVGADAIKFQSYKADRLASKNSPAYWDTSKEPIFSQHELFQKHDKFDIEQYTTLAERAQKSGIHFMSTPFDTDFVDQLETLMPAYKIASADITNFLLLEKIVRKGKPVLLSTGAATLAEVDEAVRFLKSEGVAEIALLHCVLSYPTKPQDANLNVIKYLMRAFPKTVIGYSDHLPPAFGGVALTTAWLLGARIIETHFTLDKTLPGNDHYHALDPDDVRAFLSQCSYVDSLSGKMDKEVLGCEKESRLQARRSLVAERDIDKGSVIKKEDLTAKRPGTGIAPHYISILAGAKAARSIRKDDILRWDMVFDFAETTTDT